MDEYTFNKWELVAVIIILTSLFILLLIRNSGGIL